MIARFSVLEYSQIVVMCGLQQLLRRYNIKALQEHRECNFKAFRHART